jgi:hypothetical protein
MKHTRQSRRSEQSHHTHSPYEKPDGGHSSALGEQSTEMEIKAKPSHDEVARKAYDIYLKEGCPQNRDIQHWLEAETQMSA